jgi:hypothetical protein
MVRWKDAAGMAVAGDLVSHAGTAGLIVVD